MKYIKSYDKFINEAKPAPKETKDKTEEIKDMRLDLIGNAINSLQLGGNGGALRGGSNLEGFMQLVYLALKWKDFQNKLKV